MANLTINEIDELWHTHVGSRKIFPYDEVRRLRELWESKEIPRYKTYQLYLSSKFWKALRYRVIKRDKKCRQCNSTVRLHVDHIRYPKELGTESMKDLQALCFKCHENKTKKYDMQSSRVYEIPKVTADGQLFKVLREFRI